MKLMEVVQKYAYSTHWYSYRNYDVDHGVLVDDDDFSFFTGDLRSAIKQMLDVEEELRQDAIRDPEDDLKVSIKSRMIDWPVFANSGKIDPDYLGKIVAVLEKWGADSTFPEGVIFTLDR